MQVRGSTTALSADWAAPKGQDAVQLPHPRHRSQSTWATYPDEQSMGTPLRMACMAPQQHGQQLQMA